MRIYKTPAAEFDCQIQAYLAKTFVVTDAAGKAATTEWVGREMDAGSAKSGDPVVTLFFEVPLTGGLSGYSLQHSVLSDLFKDQANLLQLHDGTQKVELRFVSGGAAKKLFLPNKLP